MHYVTYAAKSGADIWGNPLYDQYLCISNGKGGHICGGQDQPGKKWYDPLNGPGKPCNDSYDKSTCKQEEPDNECIEKCLDMIQESWVVPLLDLHSKKYFY